VHGWLFWAVIAVVAIGVVVKRLRGEPLNARDLLAPPVILTGIGIASLTKTHGLTATDLAWTGAGAALGVALGAVRGATIAVFEREGVLWQRYTARTFGAMVVSFVVMAGFGLLASKAGMHEGARPTQLTLGISFFGEALAVGVRALRTGIPFAPERKRF
jgi:hypothetical protein